MQDWERMMYTLSAEDPSPQYQPIDRKKRKGKRVEDYSRDRAAGANKEFTELIFSVELTFEVSLTWLLSHLWSNIWLKTIVILILLHYAMYIYLHMAGHCEKFQAEKNKYI